MRLTVLAASACTGLTAALIACAGTPVLAQEAICWPPAALSAHRQESVIHKGVRRAYVPMPRGRPRAASRTFRGLAEVVRRIQLPAERKLVALTFDLCEQPYEIAGYQGDIVDYLRTHRIPATFFAGGKWMLTHTTRAQQILADPLFELANHAWEHRNFRLLEGRRLTGEIEGAQLAYERTYDALALRRCQLPGQRRLAHEAAPKRLSLFRFPFGACNPRALKAVADRGLVAIQWDVSSGDPWRKLTTERMVKDVAVCTQRLDHHLSCQQPRLADRPGTADDHCRSQTTWFRFRVGSARCSPFPVRGRSSRERAMMRDPATATGMTTSVGDWR